MAENEVKDEVMVVEPEVESESVLAESDKVTAETTELGADEVAQTVANETAKGFRGVKVDPTPNFNYTVQGVTSGAPTPETDGEAAREADASVRGILVGDSK